MEISAREIEELDPAEFVEFVNSLVNAEAHQLRIPVTELKLNSYTTGREGGVDGRIEDAGRLGNNQWIPPGLSVWQFKTDRSGRNALPCELKIEASKDRVLEALRTGGRYVVAIARICDDRMRSERENVLRDTIEVEGFDRNLVRLLTADDLKRWAVEHYSLLLLPFFHRPFGECMRMEKWELDSLQQGEFVTDAGRQEIIGKLVEFVAESGGPLHKRILGQRGIGKTRVVMEALRLPGIRARVIYVPQPESIPLDFWPFLREKTESTAILAVDECDDNEAPRLRQQADACEGRVRLITIGVGEPFLSEKSENYLFLERLDDGSIRKILETQFRNLSSVQIDWIARLTAGYVRLTVACAKVVAENPSTDLAQLTRSPEIKHLLDLLLPEDNERRVMQALSLLTRVGFQDEVIDEAKTLAQFVDVPWAVFTDVTEKLRHKGLINRKGRYRYVTPDLLASWLAADIWASRTDDVRGLIDILPTTESQDAFFERIKDLGTDERTQAVIRSLLSETNFRSIDQLDNERASKIFSMLALADPSSALDALERLIGNSSTETLRHFARGRRSILNALDYIKWFNNTFFGAARLLLSLAEAENEEFSNNATGIWTGLFRLRLGGTEVPALDRLALIEETLASDTRARRVLAVKALAVAMSPHEIRGSGIEKEGPRPVPPEWHPQTYGEIWQVYRKTLQLVDQTMVDRDPMISQEARKVLFDSARTVAAIGLADEIITRLENFKPQNDIERHTLRQNVEEILRFESDKLKGNQRDKLIALQAKFIGTTYHDRIVRWVSQWSFGDWNIHEREGGLPPQGRVAELADEGLTDPEELRAELDWLVSDKAVNVGYFGQRLGELDKDHVWLADLIAKTRGEARRPILLATYLGRRSAAGDEQLVHNLLDEWTENDKQLAGVVVLTTLNLQPSKQNVDRLLKLVQKNWIQPKDMVTIVWGGWAEKLPFDALREFLECLLRDEGPVPTEAALDLLDRRLKLFPTETAILAPFAWQALARESSIHGTMAQHYWGELSKRIVHVDSLKLVDIVLGLYKSEAILLRQDDEPLKTLAEATKLRPNETWARVSEALLRKDRASYRLLLGLRDWYVRLIQVEEFLTWAGRHGLEGPRILASLTLPSDVPLNELTRQLLITYGHDDRIGNALFANFRSGAFMGSMTAWLKSKLETAEKWSEDSEPAVSNWAKRLVNDLKEEITEFRKREEEEGLI